MTRTQNVLIVDDEPNIRLGLRTTLEAMGVAVTEAPDGATALAHVARASFDGVLLDLRMPGMDGLEVLRRIRAARPTLPVVMLTAYGTVDSAVSAMKAGALDFLQKPMDPQQVRDVAAKMLVGAGTESAAASGAATGPTPSAAFTECVAAARRCARAGRSGDAIAFARRAMAALPDRPEPYHVLGVVCDLGRDRLRAQVYYRTALAFDPTYTPADRNLAKSVTGDDEPLLFGDES